MAKRLQLKQIIDMLEEKAGESLSEKLSYWNEHLLLSEI